jgi:uncharacterized protein YcnI
MHHLLRRIGRAVLVGSGAAVLAATTFAAPAWAHVTVHPSTLPAGSSDIELTFRVPNERDDAATVSVQVYFPSDLPLLSVDVQPVPGWTDTVATRTLATPITTDDGPVREVVSSVTWTATAGGLHAGQYQDFAIAAGRVPDHAGDLVFKTLQTYSSGEVVRWIQVTSSQDPNPDSPAPVLRIAPSAAEPATAVTGAPSSTQWVAIAALAVAVVAVVGVVALFVRSRRRNDGIGPSAEGRDGPAAGL